jgi:hypothetical protein
MDPALLALLQRMWGGGGGGDLGGGATPGFGGSAVPFGTPSAGVPTGGIPASPQDVSPMPVEPPPGPRLQMPTMDSLKSAIGLGGGGPSPMMSPTGGVPYGGPSQTMSSLGEALQPQPAPGTPMPMPRPPGLGMAPPPTPPTGGVPTPQPRPPGAPQSPAGGQDIAKMLQGIKMPQGPDVVKPSTPAAHQTKAVGNSELLQLLQALMPGTSRGMRMPTTLGQALELKPSSWGGIYG